MDEADTAPIMPQAARLGSTANSSGAARGRVLYQAVEDRPGLSRLGEYLENPGSSAGLQVVEKRSDGRTTSRPDGRKHRLAKFRLLLRVFEDMV